MSIIHDALNKARSSPQKEKNGPETPHKQNTVAISPSHRKKSSMNWGPLFVLSVLVLVTAPIVAPLFENSSRSLMTSSAGAADQNSSSLKNQFSIEETPTQPVAGLFSMPKNGSTPAFIVSGVVYSEAESYCLINGKVVKVGEFVNTATVLEKVTPNFVTLNRQGEKIIIAVNS